MLQIQCTQKVFKSFGIVPDEIPKNLNQTLLDVWSVNLITLWENYFLFFINNPTLYVVPIHVHGSISEINIGTLFNENLGYFLKADGENDSIVQGKIAELEPVIYTKTTGRGTLGTMNNLKQIMDVYMGREIEKSSSVNMLEIQQKLNRIPQRPIGWKYAVEAMREQLLGD